MQESFVRCATYQHMIKLYGRYEISARVCALSVWTHDKIYNGQLKKRDECHRKNSYLYAIILNTDCM